MRYVAPEVIAVEELEGQLVPQKISFICNPQKCEPKN